MNQLAFHNGRPVRSYGGLGQLSAAGSGQPSGLQSLWTTSAGSTEVNPFLLQTMPNSGQFRYDTSGGDSFVNTKDLRAAQEQYALDRQKYLDNTDPSAHAFGDASLLYRGNPGQGLGVRPSGLSNDSQDFSGANPELSREQWDQQAHRFGLDQEMVRRSQEQLSQTPEWQQLAAAGFDFSGGRPHQGDTRDIYNKSPELFAPLLSQLNTINQQAGGRFFGNPNDGGVDNTEKVALSLAKYGVTDLNDLRVQGDSVVSAKTGLPIPLKAFGGSSSGDGFTQFDLQIQDGRAIPVMRWEDSSDKGAISGALGVVGMASMPGISNMLQGSMSGLAGSLGKLGTNMLTQGLTGGVASAISGGNPLTGALTGAASAGIAGAGAPWLKNLGLSPELTQGLVSGSVSGLSSALRGGNALESALLGGAAGYTGSLLGQHGMSNQWSPQAIRMSQGALSNFIRSKGNPMAALQGGLNAVKNRKVSV